MSEGHTISTFLLDIKFLEILDLKIHGRVGVELVTLKIINQRDDK